MRFDLKLALNTLILSQNVGNWDTTSCLAKLVEAGVVIKWQYEQDKSPQIPYWRMFELQASGPILVRNFAGMYSWHWYDAFIGEYGPGGSSISSCEFQFKRLPEFRTKFLPLDTSAVYVLAQDPAKS